MDSGAVYHWDGWFVLNEGDLIYANYGAASISVWVSGTVLQGVSVVTPAEAAVPQVIPPTTNALPELQTPALPRESVPF